MREIIFELCAETFDACLAAQDGGAHRIELCTGLGEGGMTPSHGLVQKVLQRCRLPVHVLLRPRSGDFVYSDADFEVMSDDLQHLKFLGVSGVVLGVLRPDATVDVERTRELAEYAAPLEVTFHRAFDCVPSLENALEDVILTGCSRVLTSGGKRSVEQGAANLSMLVQQAAGRIAVAVGGGLTLRNAAQVANATSANHFHGSLRKSIKHGNTSINADICDSSSRTGRARRDYVVDSADVRTMVAKLKNT